KGLSRFTDPAESRLVVEGLKDGSVDVVIGTHRLLSADVEFRDLGLLIVDEEQRFGVRQKEQLRHARVDVDVLSLSATPIPRTLHAGLVGVRGISTLKSPPAGRRDVETRVAFRDDAIVRTALERELSRGGQVFLLHNRIDELEVLREMVLRLAPTAKVTIGHGQMTEAQMDKALRAFVRGEFDVLVCTSIVENGLDIPRANTILVDRADLFGLAELHQLRGRVGRSAVQAYCYLLMDRDRPPREEARKRLKALEEFSHLGAGFAIALKDLEIRGAGNLLGPQQSGHIAAIGYEMYCQLLETAVERARDERAVPYRVQEVDVDLPVRAFLPDDFVADPKERLELLREMDGAMNPERAAAIRQDLADRFGKLPRPVENLLDVFLLKHLLLEHGVQAVQLPQPDRVVVRHPPERPLGGAWLSVFDDRRAVEPGKTHLMLPSRGRKRGSWTGEAALALLIRALTT
ncbi:MAG: transcription-repair coupling factor, partial [Planctomycetes bacterium]|nr:transcription-repair coupling factor [Planctomycetota bacterium]